MARPVCELIPLWRRLLCFVLGVALILAAVGASALILSGARAVYLLLAWLAVGAFLIVRSRQELPHA